MSSDNEDNRGTEEDYEFVYSDEDAHGGDDDEDVSMAGSSDAADAVEADVGRLFSMAGSSDAADADAVDADVMVYWVYNTVGMHVPRTVTHVRIDHSVVHIPDSAFSECSALVDVWLHDGLQMIGQRAFQKCSSLLQIIIPPSVTYIDESAFNYCTALVEVVLHGGLRSIGQWAFGNCSSLLQIIIPSSVNSIDGYAFLRCTALVEVVLHDGLQTIRNSAFSGCSALPQIIIPPSVTSIDIHAFSECTALVDVLLHEGLRSIEWWAFCKCRSLLRITIPPSVTSIGNKAFSECTALVEVMLHEGLRTIGGEAFGSCSSLLCIIIPSSVSDIGTRAFGSCDLLRNVTIPSTSAITQEQFASSFPNLHDNEITLDLIKGRFDELSLHRLCNNYNPTHGTQVEVQARCDTFIQVVNQYPAQEFQRQDFLGMTPLHILLCSGRDYGMHVIQCMVEKCPDAMLIQDILDQLPLEYVLLSEASNAVINFLFMTHSNRWGALPFDFGDTIQRLARLDKPAKFVREVIRVQRTHFPSLVVDWQEIVAYAINPETIACIPIGTFRVFVEASISTRQYNCMSDEHRIEVDTRIHEIEEDNDYDEQEEDKYVEIRDMVTRYVEAHHELLQELLQEAGNTLFCAGMPKDAIKHMLLFL